MNKKINQIALLGCGRIGQMHLNNIQKISGLAVKVIVDDYINPNQYEGYTVCSTNRLDSVLDDTSIQGVLIAASSSTHVDLILKAAAYKKHIFCEKPISFSLSELQRVKAAVENHCVKLQVGFNRRFDPDFMKLKESLAQNEIGKINLIKIVNRDPKRPNLEFVKNSGGLFFDFNTHDFDMIHFLTNERIKEVYAMGNVLIDEQLKQYNDIDTTLISLKLNSGAMALIDCTRETTWGYDQRLEVLGSDGLLEVSNIPKDNLKKFSLQQHQQIALPHWSFVERYAASYLNELTVFNNYMNNTIQYTPIGIVDTIEAIKVAGAVQQSYETNTPVQLIH